MWLSTFGFRRLYGFLNQKRKATVMDSSITAFKVRAQLAGFLGIFSTRFSKPIQRFIGQMLFGIQAAQDVKLSQIGRELQEPIRIGKVENRLSRNLAHEGMAEKLHACILDHAAPSIHQDTLIIIDPTDIQKQYARKMDYLAKVRDGSKGELGENLGYNGCMAVACESGARQMSPLVLRLWSSEAPDFAASTSTTAVATESVSSSICWKQICVSLCGWWATGTWSGARILRCWQRS